ncbi:MAG: amidohydrolase family protein [Chloroflexi bacterium]|nr:amidohydrolase family protein [Chloroflexota bacterium]
MAYEIVRFPYDGAIDADGHILEPGDLWETYLEDRFKPRALRIRADDEGLEYLEIDGKKSVRTHSGALGMMGAMGDPDARPSAERTYADNIPFGASDPRERLELLEQENLNKALLYPTIGLLWQIEVEDAELADAYTRAYNRWIAEFCSDTDGRLVAIAQISMLDIDLAVAELERAVKDGCKGAWVPPFTHSKIPHGHADHDALWAKAQELDIPMALHPTFDLPSNLPQRFKLESFEAAAPWYFNVLGRQSTQQALLSFFAFGTLERFPDLRLGVLEVGAGWVGSMLDRMDAVYETVTGRDVPLKEKPSTYFRRQCFVSGDPDEPSAAATYEYVGTDRFMWASDYPHPDHTGTWVHDLVRLVEPLDDDARARVLGRNVAEIYRLS